MVISIRFPIKFVIVYDVFELCAIMKADCKKHPLAEPKAILATHLYHWVRNTGVNIYLTDLVNRSVGS